MLLRFFPAAVLCAACIASPSRAALPGLVTETDSGQVTVFDPTALQVMSAVDIPPSSQGSKMWDCEVAPGGRFGYVRTPAGSGETGNRVWVVDLTAAPPTLASGVNPIRVSSDASATWAPPEMSITPGGEYLLLPGRGLSVVDLASRQEVSVFQRGVVFAGVDAISKTAAVALVDGGDQDYVHRLRIDARGRAAIVGTALLPSFTPTIHAHFILAAPGGNSVIAYQTSHFTFFRWTASGFVETQKLNLGSYGMALGNRGNTLFLRHIDGVRAYEFDPLTGMIGAYSEVAYSRHFLRLALSPDEQTVFLPTETQVEAHRLADHTLIGALSGASISHPQFIAIGRNEFPFALPDSLERSKTPS